MNRPAPSIALNVEERQHIQRGAWFSKLGPELRQDDAHGPTTLLVVRKPDCKALLSRHAATTTPD